VRRGVVKQRMNRAMAVLLLAAALAHPAVAKEKHKTKDKRFEPAPLARMADAAGQYAGPDERYQIRRVFAGGKLSGFMMIDGIFEPLTDVRVDGSRFEATRDGKRVRATFVQRIVNGESAFGLLVDAPPIALGDGIVTPSFYRRLTP